MARRPGRPADQRHRRMALLLGALAARGSRGCDRQRLQRAMGLTGPNAERVLRRDLADLRKAGYTVESRSVGGTYVYVLRVIDPRIRRVFTPAERSELLRAARTAGLGQLFDDLDPDLSDGAAATADPRLARVQHAIEYRCVLTFGYRGMPRRVHPFELTQAGGSWMLRGREEASGTVKTFVVDRMPAVALEPPGTADSAPPELEPLVLDPMRWQRHAPMEVLVQTSREGLADVVRQVGVNGHTAVETADGAVAVTVVVTNRDAFLARLFGLGERARLLGPPEVREEARDRLRSVIEVRQ